MRTDVSSDTDTAVDADADEVIDEDVDVNTDANGWQTSKTFRANADSWVGHIYKLQVHSDLIAHL